MLESNRILITEAAEEDLLALNPDDQHDVIGVLVLLANSSVREWRRFDISLVTEDGKNVWGWEDDQFWLCFVEEDDLTITILHIKKRSPFKPPGRHPYSSGETDDG